MHYNLQYEVNIAWEQKHLGLAGTYADRSTRLRTLHELDLRITLPSKRTIFTTSSVLLDNFQVVVECQVLRKILGI